MSTHPSMYPTATSKTQTHSTNTITAPPTSKFLSSAPLPSDTRAATKGDLGPAGSYPTPVATYEEVAQNADIFLKTLKDLHVSLGTKFMIPTLGGRTLDLHRLFVEVTARGGLEKVIENRKWKEIISIFSLPGTTSNASFTLRKYYLSLLHNYEQIYYLRKEHQRRTLTNIVNGPVSGSPALQVSTETSREDGTNKIQLPANSGILPGNWVSGTIDGKFDYGYLVTVSVGSEKLKGVLYHVPVNVEAPRASEIPQTDASLQPRRRRKRSKRGERPNPNRNGYNCFFAEQYARLKSNQDEERQELNICRFSTVIGNLWSQLSEAERQVYREKGLAKQSGLNP